MFFPETDYLRMFVRPYDRLLHDMRLHRSARVHKHRREDPRDAHKRWQRSSTRVADPLHIGLSLVGEILNDATARLLCERHISPEARTLMETLYQLLEQMSERGETRLTITGGRVDLPSVARALMATTGRPDYDTTINSMQQPQGPV